MSQRNSGYARIPGDTYVTPRWVWEALYSVEQWAVSAWDCAPLNADFDFLSYKSSMNRGIATNPPFSLADKFIRHALIYAPDIAMLLPMQFDSARGRRDLFAENERFRAKYTLTKRIRWENLVQKENGPSQNHAWYIWGCSVPFNSPRIPIMGWLP